jgi:large subunit ribosomal protein L29
MKANEIRDLSLGEIAERIKEEEDELAKLRFQHAAHSIPNPTLLRTKRRDIARLKTILNEKKRAGEAAA